MTLLLSFAVTVLAIAVGQSDGSRDRRTGDDSAAPGVTPSAPGTFPPYQSTGDTSGMSGVPYMPSTGEDLSHLRGTFLDAALQVALRTQTLSVSDSGTTWGTDLEVTPGIALGVESSVFSLSVGYAPRFTVPFRTGVPDLAILNRATLLATWRPDPLWAVAASGTFIWGEYSQLAPATTPGGAGPPPPTLDPVRSFETYPYVDINALLTIQRALSPRSRIRLGGGYFNVGGVGSVGQANQPRTWGPIAEAAFAWDASRAAVLTTAATIQNWMFTDESNLVVAMLTESWRQSWTSDLESTLVAGPGWSNQDVDGPTGAHHLVPVGSFRLDYRPVSRHPVVLSLLASLAPYVDVYLHTVSEQFTLRASLDWRPSDAWHLGAALSGALANASPTSPGAYGNAGLSASLAVSRFLILSLGGFTQAQFPTANAGVVPFWQWSAVFSLSLHDRISL